MRSKLFLVLIVMVVLASGAWAQDCPKDTITVNGMGKITAKPDVAYVTLRVKADGILMVDAAEKMQQKIDEVQKAIKAKQSDIKDIAVTDVSIGQKDATWGPDEQDAARPEIIKQMRITIAPDPKVAFDIVDAAIRAGASMDLSDTYSYGDVNSVIVYGLIKSEEAEAEAQAKAMEDSKTKAGKLAALTGKTVGDATSIGCEGGSSWPFQFEMRGANEFPVTYVSVDPSKIEIAYGMNVSFLLVKK